jgi:serine/threonine protein kinase
MPFSLRGFFRKLLRKTKRKGKEKEHRIGKDKEKLSAEERLALLRSYQQKFKWHGSDLSVAGEAPTDFTTIADLQKALSREDVEKLLQLSPDYPKASLDLIYARLLRVIGILIKIDWCNWEDFPGIFLERGKRGIWDVHAKRADDSLPFELADLRFLEPPEWQRLFYERQFSFAPVLIIEDKFDTYTSSQRLPFKSCDFEAGGAYGDVYKVVIARSCIRCTKGTLAGDRNNKERLMARKISKGGEASLKAEKEMQDLLKRGSAESKCIQLSFATFLHGSTLNILYPWADLDLFQFLHGNYVGFSERATVFTPFLILEQMMLLAGGLHFIHQELFPNEEVQCAHLDFKPENILVFWPDDSLFERRPKKKSTLKPSVGTWKISDFGISRTRPNTRPQVHTLYPPDQVVDATRDRSSMDAPRKAGPYQPPEARDGGRVSWSTDMWSFGCVACVALGFIIGGPHKVFELDRARLSDGNDYFWTAHLPNEYIVKPQILNWLDEEQSKAFPEHKSWIQRYIHMIRRLLQVDKKSRPTAAEVRSELNTNRKLAKDLSNTWTPPANDPFVEKTSEPDQHEFTPSSFGVPSDIDNEGDSPVRRTPSPRHLSQYLAPTEGSRRVAELVPSSRRSSEIVRAWPPLSGLSQPSRPWPAVPNSTWYARLDTPTNTFQSKLSPTAETVAFCSKESVYVYDLQKILNSRQLWQETAQHGKEGFNEGLKRYHASTGRSWTSVSLAGSFIALRSKADNDDSLVSGCLTVLFIIY